MPPLPKTADGGVPADRSAADDRVPADRSAPDGGVPADRSAADGGVGSVPAAGRADSGSVGSAAPPQQLGAGDEAPSCRHEPAPSRGATPTSAGCRSPADSDDSDDFRPALSADDQTLRKGDVVTAKYRKLFLPALVTSLKRKKVTVKFICDLVKFKRAVPFSLQPRACRLLTYSEKVRCQDVARASDPAAAELLRLSLDAAEELQVSRATCAASQAEDDPEEFLKTKCDYIVRLLQNSGSPVKGPPVASPVKGALAAGSSAAPPGSPLRPSPSPSASAAASPANSEDEDGDERDPPSPSPPPTRPPAPPPLPPQLREEQRAYAARLMEVIESAACERHLRAVHAGREASWRRDAYRSGGRRRLMAASVLGDLTAFPELAGQVRSRARQLVDRLRRRPDCPGIYAEEVLAPEAMRFAMASLSDRPRTSDDLDSELALGASQFRV